MNLIHCNRVFTIAATMVITAALSGVAWGAPNIRAMQQFSPSGGWTATPAHLFITNSSGLEWREITPNFVAGTRLSNANFLNSSDGVVLGFRDGSFTMARTSDGGATWSLAALTVSGAVPAGLSGESSVTRNGAAGTIRLRLISSSNFVRSIELATSDGGQTWVRQTDPPIQANEPLSKVTPPAGWLIRSEGTCAGFKNGCTQSSRLYSTVDGGVTVTDITPAAADETAPGGSAQTALPEEFPEFKNYATRISTNMGFDQCSTGSVSGMQAWFTSSPYRDANIYIGGSNRGCSQPNLSASYVSSLGTQGWGIIPTWVGPQAPCNGFNSSISSTTSTAASQGVTEAQSASSAANSYSLGSSIIYYDMEAYTSSSCNAGAAVGAFLNSWTQELHSLGFLAGVYGSPSNAQSDWTALANEPDAVWIADWNGNSSVLNIPGLSNSYWPTNQRIHQYEGGNNETWGGVTYNIDNDNEDAPVASVGGGGGGSNILVDPGFEQATVSGNSAPGWTGQTNISGHDTIIYHGSYPHSGTNYGYLGANNNDNDYLFQIVTIASTAKSAMVQYWLNVVTQETTTTTAYDLFTVEVHDMNGNNLGTLQTYSNLSSTNDGNANGVYFQPPPVSMLQFAGKQVKLVFHATTDVSKTTTFRVDDVSLTVQ